ncbi:MAG: DUF4911 domain-containing protein [Pseudomonadota bacterium]
MVDIFEKRDCMETIVKNYRVQKSRIGFLKFIFEAHDGLAVITTLDAASGLVKIIMAPGCVDETRAVLDDLKKDFLIDEV